MRVLADAVGPALEEVLSGMGIADEVWTGLLGPATVEEHGDLALPCHRLAGTLHRQPNDIADDIAAATCGLTASINSRIILSSKRISGWRRCHRKRRTA